MSYHISVDRAEILLITIFDYLIGVFAFATKCRAVLAPLSTKRKETSKHEFGRDVLRCYLPGGAVSAITAALASSVKETPGGIDSTSFNNFTYSSVVKISLGLLLFTNSLNLQTTK